ncbi:Fic family protein [Arenibacter algicola]|uniref:Fic/DOC family protein n=1 Tax=Arenibacter algicola TaxID=616991 RepID=A0A221UU57_9FLAO|nr:Fic family protein [Arenibacter algicola]ASO04790.1 Fic/DOC family protein [Arenibacter algicola]
MSSSPHFSTHAPIFQGRKVPEEGVIVGYAAIIQKLGLKVPMPSQIALVCQQNKKYQSEDWNVLPKSYLPDDNGNLTEIEALYKHLVFSLKYEGINLLFFSFLAKHYYEEQLSILVSIEPTGQYSRRIWFLLEWIMQKPLAGKEDLTKKSYVPLLDENLQYAIEGIRSSRHLIINNLPGTPDFCPLIFKTEKLENYISSKLSERENEYLKGIRKDILQRAAAFLLLKDSKASFTIEGESPRSKRAARWGQTIGQAGYSDLSKEEFIRLQQIVIENPRFIDIGFRKKGGFVGEHDRTTGEPIPDHFSARWQDIEKLINGLLETNRLLLSTNMDAVLIAASIAFGFVFIHPLQDGNGRIHRYLIHHILAKKQFSQQGIIFPISASILDHITDYRKVLEAYSHPLLDFIEWKETPDHNVEVINETLDYYRYYNATKQAEFLFDCVNDTIENVIPKEVVYLRKFDAYKRFLEDEYEMPDKMIATLVRFLEQNEGQLSQRARKKEFNQLKDEEIHRIEKKFNEIFK